MPCYQLSWESYGDWSPQPRSELVVGRQRVFADRVVAGRFRTELPPEACFDAALQRQLLDEARIAAAQENLRLHAAAADAKSLGVIVSWPDDRSVDDVRAAIRQCILRRLRAAGLHTWLSHRGVRRQILDRADLARRTEQFRQADCTTCRES